MTTGPYRLPPSDNVLLVHWTWKLFVDSVDSITKAAATAADDDHHHHDDDCYNAAVDNAEEEETERIDNEVAQTSNYHSIECLINNEYTVSCRQNSDGEVYLPFKFIGKYFEVSAFHIFPTELSNVQQLLGHSMSYLKYCTLCMFPGQKNDFGLRAFSSAAPQIWNHIYLLLSESHHQLAPSSVTSKLSTLPPHNMILTTYRISLASLISICKLCCVIIYFTLLSRPSPRSHWPTAGQPGRHRAAGLPTSATPQWSGGVPPQVKELLDIRELFHQQESRAM